MNKLVVDKEGYKEPSSQGRTPADLGKSMEGKAGAKFLFF
jgi:hypothetical protein